MAYYVGRRAAVGLAKEASRGTPTAPTYYLPYESISFDDKTVTQDIMSAMGRIEDSDNSVVVKEYGEGDLEAILDDKAIGLILTGLAGAAPSSNGPTNFTHTYTLSNTNQHQSLSIAVQDPNHTKVYPLAMIDSFTINVVPEDLVKYTCSFRSANGRDWSTLTPDYTSLGNRFNHKMVSFKLAADTASLAAATKIDVRALDITFSKNIEDFNDIGTATPSDIVNKQLTIEGSVEIGYSDETYKNYMLNSTGRAVEIAFTYGANNSLTIQLPKVTFRSWEGNKGLDDIATETIAFKGHYDATNAVAAISTLSLKNQVASY